VRDDRRFTISDLSLHFPQISRTLLCDNVSNHLGYRKVCARWVSKMLTVEHKKTAHCMCFDISDALLQGRRRHVEPYCDRRRDMGVPYHLFLHLKKFLGGKRFDDDNDLKDAVQKWLTSQAAAFYEKGI